MFTFGIVVGFIIGSVITGLVVRKNVHSTNAIIAWIKSKLTKKV